MATDQDLLNRCIAAAAQEGVWEPGPQQWAAMHIWHLASSPGWADAYDYAVNAGNTEPGKDGAVITDAMILAAVQKRMDAMKP
jgi:hypothetical protein